MKVMQKVRHMPRYRFLDNFNLMRTSSPDTHVEASRALVSLLEVFVDCADSGVSRVVTIWPRRIEESGFLHQMAVLWHVVGVEDEDEVGVQAATLTCLATLHWPFSKDSLRRLGGVLADRRILSLANKRHLNGNIHRCYEWHIQLRRIGDLNPELNVRRSGRVTTLQEHEELQNPSFAELAPIVMTGEDGTPLMDDCRSRFLGRVRKFTQIKAGNVPGSLFDLSATPYLLMGVPGETDAKKVGARLLRLRRPDVVVIDIDAAARLHGENWPAKTLALLRAVKYQEGANPLYGEGVPLSATTVGGSLPPVFALTEVPYLAHLFSTEVLPSYATGKAVRRVVFNVTRDMTSQVQCVSPGSRNPAFTVTCLARHLTPFLVAADKLQRDLEPLDTSMAEMVRDMGHFIRRAVCMPGGIGDYDSFVESSGRRHYVPGQPLGMAAALLELERKGNAGKEAGRVTAFAREFLDIVNGLGEATPAAMVFRRLVVAGGWTESGDALVVFPDRTTESFAHWLIDALKVRDGQPEQKLADVTTVDSKAGIDRLMPILHKFDKAYLFLPRWSAVARIVACHNTPEVVHLLCDEATAESIRHQAEMLRAQPQFRPVHERLALLLRSLEEALEGVPLPIPVMDEVRFGPSSLSRYEGEGRPLLVRLDDGKEVPLFEGSQVITYRADAEPRPFSLCAATTLVPGDAVFFMDEDFVAMVSRHCRITVDANPMLDAYHRQVAALRYWLPGGTLREKARHVLRTMEVDGIEPLPDETTVMTWLDVERLIGAPVETVRPQAPHSEAWFRSFTAAIGMLPAMMASYWKFAIFDTRSKRISAGFGVSRFCTAVLTDPESVLSFFSGDREDMQRFSDWAREELAEVVDVVKVR